ncbi:MAG: hypothetical protein AAGA30_05465 [Planctomycetota bacterium]
MDETQPLGYARLNQEFGIPDKVDFCQGCGGLTMVKLVGHSGQAELYLHGAHLTRLNLDQQNLLWLSPKAQFETGKAIRGGVPICWPWFGPHPSNSSRPSHGFVRNQEWRFVSSAATKGITTVELQWSGVDDLGQDCPFAVNLKVSLGKCLQTQLTSTNQSGEVQTVGGALHSYFEISQTSNVRLHGL